MAFDAVHLPLPPAEQTRVSRGRIRGRAALHRAASPGTAATMSASWPPSTAVIWSVRQDLPGRRAGCGAPGQRNCRSTSGEMAHETVRDLPTISSVTRVRWAAW